MTPSRFLAVLAAAHAPLSLATAEDLVSEADYFSEQPVVLSASRLSQPVNRAPAAVTVITREMIEASGLRHLVDVLRLVPGFVVGWSGGNMPAASYIGLSDEFPHWMQIMVDGRSVYNPAYGHTTWRGIPLTLDEVDRIEVVRGPNAANDGLNAMLGTVHIYTRHSAATQGGMAEVAAGDARYKEANLRYGGETANGSWRLSLLGREDERHDVAHDRASDVQMSFRGDVQPTLKDELMLQFGAAKGSWQGSNVGVLLDEAQDADYLSGYVNLQWKRALEPAREWLLQVHHTFNQNDEDFDLPSFLRPQDGNYRATGSAVQFTYLDQSDSEWRTTVTGEYRAKRLDFPGLVGREGYIHDNIARLSGAAEWNPDPRWVVHAAAMAEYHSDTDEMHFSPRVAVNWLPSREHAFRIGVSHAASSLALFANNIDYKLTTQSGTLVDQYYLNTDAVDAESINSVELGYLFSKPEWGVNLDVRAYQNRMYDILHAQFIGIEDPKYAEFVDAQDGNGWRTYINQVTVEQHGLEYQLRWQPTPKGWLVLSQSWMSFDSGPDEGYHPRSIPNRTLSLLASHLVGGVGVSLGYYHTSEMRWFGGAQDSKYNRLDLRLAKDWKVADGRIAAALVIQSLLGEEDESFDSYTGQIFDRRGYVSLKYEFR